MKLQTLVLGLGLAIAATGSAFARDVTVIRHGDGDVTRVVRHDDGDVTRIVRHRDNDRDVTRIVRHRDERDFGRMRVLNPGHHYGWYRNRRVVIIHPAHRHHHYIARRTVIVRHYG